MCTLSPPLSVHSVVVKVGAEELSVAVLQMDEVGGGDSRATMDFRYAFGAKMGAWAVDRGAAHWCGGWCYTGASRMLTASVACVCFAYRNSAALASIRPT